MMTDVTSHTPERHRSRRGQQREYAVYFGIIFLCALPFALIGCLRDTLTGRQKGPVNPIERARREASRVTPLIFSA